MSKWLNFHLTCDLSYQNVPKGRVTIIWYIIERVCGILANIHKTTTRSIHCNTYNDLSMQYTFNSCSFHYKLDYRIQYWENKENYKEFCMCFGNCCCCCWCIDPFDMTSHIFRYKKCKKCIMPSFGVLFYDIIVGNSRMLRKMSVNCHSNGEISFHIAGKNMNQNS